MALTRFVRGLAAAALMALVVVGFARAQSTWTGAVDNNWSTPGNWSPNGVPTATTDVIIPAGATAVTVPNQVSCRSLTTARAMTISSQMVLTAGVVLQSSAIVTLNGGYFYFSSGTQSITGSGTIRSGFNSSGALYIVSGTQLTIGSGITIATDPGTTGSSSIYFYFYQQTSPSVVAASVTNNGTIRCSGDANRSLTMNNQSGSTNSFTNGPTGVLEVASGASLELAVDWTNNGTFILNAATMTLRGTYSNIGAINRTGGTLNLGGTLTPSPTFTLTAATGSANIVGAVQGGTLAATGGSTYTVNSTSTFNGTVTITAPVNVTSQLNVNGDITLSGSPTITFSGGYLYYTGGTHAINGTGTLAVAASSTGSMYLTAGAAVTLGSGVTLTTSSTSSSQFYFYFYQQTTPSVAGASLINNGTIVASGTSRSINFSNQSGPAGLNSFTNNGQLQAIGGTLDIGTIGYTNTGTLTLNTGGVFTSIGVYTLSGLGTITRDVAASTINLGGTFNAGASFTLSNATGPINFSANFTNTTFTALNGLTYTFSGGTHTNCTYNAPLTVAGATTMSGCTFGTNANINSQCSISNGVTLTGNPTLTFNGGYLYFTGGTQQIAGTGVMAAAINNAGYMYLNTGTVLTIGAGITVRTDTGGPGSGQFYFYFYTNNGPPITGASLINNGAIIATGSNRTVNFSNQSGALGVNSIINNGSIQAVNSGTVNVGASLAFTNSGTLTLNTSGTFNLDGAYSGIGTLVRSGGTLNLGGNFNPGGTFQLSNALGPVNINANLSNATLTAIDGLSYNFTGGALNNVTLNAPATIASSVSSTGLTVGAPLTINSAVTMTGDLILVSPALPATPTQITFNGGYIQFNDGGTRQICGTGELVSGYNNSGSLYMQSGSQLTLCPNIVVRTADIPALPTSPGSSSWYFYFYQSGGTTPTGAKLTNQGQIRAAGSNRSLNFSNQVGPAGINSFVNTGTVSVTGATSAAGNVTGVLWDNTGGTTVLNTGGTLNLAGVTSPAQLGTLTRDPANSTLSIGGTFNVTGSTFTLTPAIGPANFSCNFSNITLSATGGLVPNFVSSATNPTLTNVTLSSPVTFSSASATLVGCTIGANCTATSSNITVNGSLTFAGGAQLTSAGSNLYTPGTQSILGSGSLVSAAGNSLSFYLQDGAVLTITPGITIDGYTGSGSSSNVYFYFYRQTAAPNSPAQLINNGTIRSAGVSRSISFSTQTVGAHSVVNNGTIEFGTSVQGASTVNLTNNGELITGPGSLLVMGQGTTLSLGPTGRYTSQINGPAGTTNTIGRIVAGAGTTNPPGVAGAALSIGGTVRVQYVAGYDPTACRPPADIISRNPGTPQGTITGTFAASQVPPNLSNRLPAVGYRTGDSVFYVSTSAADIATLGGAAGADGQLTADDIVLFLNAFFAGNISRADVAGLGGTPGPDGQLSADDVVYFLASFFAGCGT